MGSHIIRRVTLRIPPVGSNDFGRDPKREFALGVGRQERWSLAEQKPAVLAIVKINSISR